MILRARIFEMAELTAYADESIEPLTRPNGIKVVPAEQRIVKLFRPAPVTT